jgi:DNA repair exonuclease SbcCD ATPase subunit
MIRRLMLQNWRSYEDIALDFGPGTTFIVAPNGIGKTSLMEAAAWAVFGDSGRQPRDAVRLGRSAATATADVELPDHRVLRISRTLPKRPNARLPQPVISIDGVETGESQAVGELRRSYSADPAFLLRLAMHRGHIDSSSPADFGLLDHLCRFLGVEELRNAVDSLEQRIKAQEKLIRAAKQGRPADVSLISALREREALASSVFGETESAYERVVGMLDRAHEAEHARRQLSEWQQQATAYSNQLAQIAETATPDLRLDPQRPDSVQSALDAALSAAQAHTETLRVEQAVLRGRADAIGQHTQELQSAHGDCPVCRRPLDEETISHAESAQAAELERIVEETEQLRSAEARAIERQQHVRSLIERFHAIRRPGPSPTSVEIADSDAAGPPELFETERRRLMAELVDRKSELARVRQDLDTALREEAAHSHLERLYAEEAVLRASHDAISSITAELLDATIQPLAAELAARWHQVFPRRGQLKTQSNGDVSRELDGESLPYSAFSTGERTGLIILLRLLVLETATKANFCWFDEPLEHLDPEARRHVAEALARASNIGRLSQIVVSTYEESLARRLQERDPDNVTLIYVRQSTD